MYDGTKKLQHDSFLIIGSLPSRIKRKKISLRASLAKPLKDALSNFPSNLSFSESTQIAYRIFIEERNR